MPFIKAAEMVEGFPLPGWTGRFFHSDHITLAHWDIAEDAADLHRHQHVQEEVWNVVEGHIALWIDSEERCLGPGDAAVVPTDIPHSAQVLGACRAIVVDYPLRINLPGVSRS